MIKRFIIGSIYEIRTDVAQLHAHIVQCCRNRTRSYVVAVFRGPAYEDGVAVGVCQKDGGSGVGSPCVFQSAGPEAEGDDAG